MDKFRDAYRQAAERLPEFHMDASCVQDELHHRKFIQKKGKRLLFRSCSAAAALCLLCGTGVAAKNYRDSVLEMRNNGFVLTDQENAARIMAEDTGGTEPEVCQATGFADGGTPAADDGMDTGRVMDDGDVVPEKLEGIEAEPVEYDSVEAFRKAESLVVAIPEKEFFPVAMEEESILILEGGNQVFVRFMGDGVYFHLSQQDHRDCEGYSSAVAYMGEVANERTFTNSQGLQFTIFDTVENGELDAVHAVISLNGRDLTMDFKGFEEQVIEEILRAMDMSVYFED